MPTDDPEDYSPKRLAEIAEANRKVPRETLNLTSLFGPNRVGLKAIVYLEDDKEVVYTVPSGAALSGTDVLTVDIKGKLFIKMGVDREIVFGSDTNKSRAERRRQEREEQKRSEQLEREREALRLITVE